MTETEKNNGIATGAQIRQYAEGMQWGPEELVVCPESGFRFIMRRPTRIYFALRQMSWPMEFRAKLERLAEGFEGVEFTDEEDAFYNRLQDEMVWDAFINPKPSLTPDVNQFDPRILI